MFPTAVEALYVFVYYRTCFNVTHENSSSEFSECVRTVVRNKKCDFLRVAQR